MEVTKRRGRRRKKLLNDLKDRTGYSHLKEEALDRTMWRNCFGKRLWTCRHTEYWMNETDVIHVVMNTEVKVRASSEMLIHCAWVSRLLVCNLWLTYIELCYIHRWKARYTKFHYNVEHCLSDRKRLTCKYETFKQYDISARNGHVSWSRECKFINPLTPELNPSTQSCLPIFLLGFKFLKDSLRDVFISRSALNG
jgi:hypothetical protein